MKLNNRTSIIISVIATVCMVAAMIIQGQQDQANRESYATAHNCKWYDNRTSAGPVCIPRGEE